MVICMQHRLSWIILNWPARKMHDQFLSIRLAGNSLGCPDESNSLTDTNLVYWIFFLISGKMKTKWQCVSLYLMVRLFVYVFANGSKAIKNTALQLRLQSIANDPRFIVSKWSWWICIGSQRVITFSNARLNLFNLKMCWTKEILFVWQNLL